MSENLYAPNVEVFSVDSKSYLKYNKDMQIPYVGGAMVSYGENSLLYVGGRGSDRIYQFLGKEMRAKVFKQVSLIMSSSDIHPLKIFSQHIRNIFMSQFNPNYQDN